MPRGFKRAARVTLAALQKAPSCGPLGCDAEDLAGQLADVDASLMSG